MSGARRWHYVQLQAAFKSWRESVTGILHERVIIRKACRFLSHRQQYTAWKTWAHWVRYRVRMRTKLRGVFSKRQSWLFRALQIVMSRWRAHVYNHRVAELAAHQHHTEEAARVHPLFLVARRALSKCIARSWAKWKALLMHGRNVDAFRLRYMRRTKRRLQKNMLHQWKEKGKKRARLRHVSALVTARMQKRFLHRALGEWSYFWGRRVFLRRLIYHRAAESRQNFLLRGFQQMRNWISTVEREELEQDRACELLRRMLQRALESWVYRAWHTWRHYAATVARRDRLLKTGSLSMLHARSSKALRQWRSAVKKQKRLRVTAKRVTARIRTIHIATVWRHWQRRTNQRKQARKIIHGLSSNYQARAREGMRARFAKWQNRVLEEKMTLLIDQHKRELLDKRRQTVGRVLRRLEPLPQATRVWEANRIAHGPG